MALMEPEVQKFTVEEVGLVDFAVPNLLARDSVQCFDVSAPYALVDVPKVPLKENHFPYNNLPDIFKKRFIELLPTMTNHMFSFTSKRNYIECLKIRGLEVEYFNLYCNETKLHKSGRLCLPVDGFPAKWKKVIKWINHFEVYETDPDDLELAKLSRNIVYFGDYDMKFKFPTSILHSNLKTLCVVVGVGDVVKLADVLAFLKAAKDLNVSNLQLGLYDLDSLPDIPDTKAFSRAIEDWAKKNNVVELLGSHLATERYFKLFKGKLVMLHSKDGEQYYSTEIDFDTGGEEDEEMIEEDTEDEEEFEEEEGEEFIDVDFVEEQVNDEEMNDEDM